MKYPLSSFLVRGTALVALLFCTIARADDPRRKLPDLRCTEPIGVLVPFGSSSHLPAPLREKYRAWASFPGAQATYDQTMAILNFGGKLKVVDNPRSWRLPERFLDDHPIQPFLINLVGIISRTQSMGAARDLHLAFAGGALNDLIFDFQRGGKSRETGLIEVVAVELSLLTLLEPAEPVSDEVLKWLTAWIQFVGIAHRVPEGLAFSERLAQFAAPIAGFSEYGLNRYLAEHSAEFNAVRDFLLNWQSEHDSHIW